MEAILGVDVSSKSLDACVLKNGRSYARSFEYNLTGCRQLIRWAKKHEVAKAAAEATGGYEQRIVQLMALEGLRVHVVNPAQVRNLARGIGKIAKTDRIDARVIARFAQIVELPEPVKVSPAQMELKELLMRRAKIMKMIQAERNRKRFAQGDVMESIKETIAFLSQQKTKIERKIEYLRKSNPDIAANLHFSLDLRGEGVHRLLYPVIMGLSKPQAGATDAYRV